jgi:hypothetical protein
MPDIPLTQVRVNGVGGVLSLIREANLAWKLSLNFSRFDGDTLTGKIKGVLEGSDSRGLGASRYYCVPVHSVSPRTNADRSLVG